MNVKKGLLGNAKAKLKVAVQHKQNVEANRRIDLDFGVLNRLIKAHAKAQVELSWKGVTTDVGHYKEVAELKAKKLKDHIKIMKARADFGAYTASAKE